MRICQLKVYMLQKEHRKLIKFLIVAVLREFFTFTALLAQLLPGSGTKVKRTLPITTLYRVVTTKTSAEFF